VACRGVTEQREELEKPWCLKANHTSSEYPVACGGDLLSNPQALLKAKEMVTSDFLIIGGGIIGLNVTRMLKK